MMEVEWVWAIGCGGEWGKPAGEADPASRHQREQGPGSWVFRLLNLEVGHVVYCIS